MSGKSVFVGAYTAFPTPYISELTRSRLYGSLTQTGLHSIVFPGAPSTQQRHSVTDVPGLDNGITLL
jgi:hypothetical protein